jgi:predicted ATPase/DNA-binding XRE family transcriptional regulator
LSAWIAAVIAVVYIARHVECWIVPSMGGAVVSADRVSQFVMPFGPLLRRYRAAAGLTQEELAARAGLSVRAISDLERGLKRPRRDTVNLLAEALVLPPRRRALLEAAARPATETAPADRTAALPPNNLPAQLTALLGREREALAAAEQLRRADVRLLTLTGPGGVGKTRLALQVAEDVLERFDDGVYLVPLAALRDPALVVPAIVEAIGMRVVPGEPLDAQVHLYLRDRRMLLVLDNFEHVLPAAAQVAELLAACPRVEALVTSREPLRIDGEHEMPVAPLDDGAAVELFVQRASAAHPALDMTAEDLATVEAICRRLDRLPLAIELAAVWMKILPLPALLERLANRLEMLTSGRRDAPERQRTLRGTIAWSEHLLEPGERRLFHRLAVFAGGCTPEAAEVVCGEAGEPALDGLAALVEKSLLQVSAHEDGPRFWMLEMIREYALERLHESGEEEEFARRHAEYYARLVPKLAWVDYGQDARDRVLERELPNFRAALGWARAQLRADVGLQVAAALGRYWFAHGSFEEGESWLRELLALDAREDVPAVHPILRVRALYQLILFTLDRHDFERAEALAREGLELARSQGDAGSAGDMLAELGHVAEGRGDLDGAMALFEESLAQIRFAESGEPESRHGGALGRTLSSLGNLARAKGDYDKAQRYLEEQLAWARERNFSFAVASGLTSLGHLACDRGDYAGAAALYRESLALYRSLPNPVALAWCLEGVVVVLAQAGDYVGTMRLCGAIAGLQQVARAAAAAVWRPFAQARAAAIQALGEDQYAAAYSAGATLSPERAIAEALDGLDRSKLQ